jgi:hypothetical protein
VKLPGEIGTNFMPMELVRGSAASRELSVSKRRSERMGGKVERLDLRTLLVVLNQQDKMIYALRR